MNRCFCQTSFTKPITVIGLFLIVIFSKHSTAELVTIAFTADSEGHGRLARQCCGDPGAGGISRRATLLKLWKAQQSKLLLVDTGNALYGDDSLDGQLSSAAYDALGYDAMNISYCDFRRGITATVDLLAHHKTKPLSANMIHENSNKPIFRPYIVKHLGSERIAILGVTQSPAALNLMPHLKTELAGICIQPPAEALAEWLPKAKAESDHVILLYYGSAAGLQPLAEKFGAQIDAILIGGARPEEVREDANPPQIATEQHGREIAVFHLGANDANGKPKIARIAVDASIEPDPAMEKLLQQFDEQNR